MKRKGWVSSIFGFMAFLLSYLFSIVNNTWQTSLFRASIGFLLFFALGFMLTTVLQQVLMKRTAESVGANPPEKGKTEEQLEVNEEDGFQSISLQTLHSGGEQKPSDEAVTKAARSWIKENGGDSR